MKTLMTLLLLSVAACGGPEFTGRWDGVLTQRTKCSNGSADSRELALHLAATQEGHVLSLAGNTSCGTITATVDDDTATLFPIECALIAAEGFTYTDTIEGGTMTVRGNSLDVNAVMSTVLRGQNGTVVFCSGPLTGMLRRKD